jgi:cytochrome c oxidase subunit 2
MKKNSKPSPRNDRPEREAPAKVRIAPWVFWIAICILIPLTLSAADNGDTSLTTSIFATESTFAYSIVRLSVLVLAIAGTIFVVVFSLIVYAVVRFRLRSDDDGKEPSQVYGSNYVEMAWTLVPVIIVVVLTLTTARIIHEIQEAPKFSDALDVRVIGHQFRWECRYPKFGVETANELHVPVSLGGHRMLTFLDLRSADVVHSFWVPLRESSAIFNSDDAFAPAGNLKEPMEEVFCSGRGHVRRFASTPSTCSSGSSWDRLAGKTELVPNKTNTMWMEPERTGLYLGQCSKYCGTQHS